MENKERCYDGCCISNKENADRLHAQIYDERTVDILELLSTFQLPSRSPAVDFIKEVPTGCTWRSHVTQRMGHIDVASFFVGLGMAREDSGMERRESLSLFTT